MGPHGGGGLYSTVSPSVRVPGRPDECPQGPWVELFHVESAAQDPGVCVVLPRGPGHL